MSFDQERCEALTQEIEALRLEAKLLLVKLVASRRALFSTPGPASEAENERLETEFAALNDRLHAAVDALGRELKDVLPERPPSKPQIHRTRRAQLRAEDIPPTGLVEDILPIVLRAFHRQLPRGWLKEEPASAHGLGALRSSDAYLSLVKGVRLESERPAVHRFRQALRLAEDFLQGRADYDHFAGALLIPQLCRLGSQLRALQEVGGDVQGRLQSLWMGSSDRGDATVYELLVGAAFAERGLSAEFLQETKREATPDLRCHDPYPLLIECKRRQTLSEYEVGEQAIMDSIFRRLDAGCGRAGVAGVFEIVVRVEPEKLSAPEFADNLFETVRRPPRYIDHPWGRSRFRPLEQRVDLTRPLRLYAPQMLEEIFGWSADLPKWDGLVCRIDNVAAPQVGHVERPRALLWNNTSKAALIKRTKTPVNLFAKGVSQITKGEFGVIYVAHQEGARAPVADRRFKSYLKQLNAFWHTNAIRVPVTMLNVLLPRALGDGAPDLIENCVKLSAANIADAEDLADYIPSLVFTASPLDRAD